MVAFKRKENLKDSLVHRKHNNQFFKKKSGTFKCKTKNIVYGIYCECCKKIMYVGETGNDIYTRHMLTLSRIRTGNSFTEHFRSSHHSAEDLKIFGIEKINDTGTIFRRVREMFWIKKLKTQKPFGLNKKLENNYWKKKEKDKKEGRKLIWYL